MADLLQKRTDIKQWIVLNIRYSIAQLCISEGKNCHSSTKLCDPNAKQCHSSTKLQLTSLYQPSIKSCKSCCLCHYINGAVCSRLIFDQVNSESVFCIFLQEQTGTNGLYNSSVSYIEKLNALTEVGTWEYF